MGINHCISLFLMLLRLESTNRICSISCGECCFFDLCFLRLCPWVNCSWFWHSKREEGGYRKSTLLQAIQLTFSKNVLREESLKARKEVSPSFLGKRVDKRVRVEVWSHSTDKERDPPSYINKSSVLFGLLSKDIKENSPASLSYCTLSATLRATRRTSL